MNIQQINSIYILGLGALGSMYAAKFYDMDPQSVKIIADKKRSGLIQTSGVSVNEINYAFNCIEPNDAAQPPADLIIIAVKYPQLQQAILDVKNFVGENTIVISLLNGITSEEHIGAGLGIQHVVHAYAVGMDAVRERNGTTYKNPGRIVFGELFNDVLTNRVTAVKAVFEQAQIPHHIPVDMQRAMWAKFMMNTGVNQVSAVLKAPYGVFQQNQEARKLMLAAANEVLLLAGKANIGLEQTDVDDFVRILDGLNPTGKTSMLQDIEAGRKSEVDIFAGTVIKLGERYGMPTPVNQTLYSIIKVMQGD